jgi:methylmalonyl-CoA/ethylmalonyl-CoA epimerase
MHKIDHIALAVKSLTNSIPLFEKLLNTPCYKTETVDAEGVNTAFFKTGDTKIELLESIDQEGVIARFIGKKGEGMHHSALLVEDIYSEIDRLKEAIRRLADQDATLSVCNGNVIVTMDATLTDEEREAVEWASTVDWGSNPHAATLRGLLERLGGAA